MLRALFVLPAPFSLTASASSEIAATSLGTVFAQPHAQNRLLHSLGMSGSHLSTPLAQSCCEICSVGKACGNT
jgi:hypothetical protein